MSAHHDIIIRFLRKGSTQAANTDDILTISKIAENKVRINYVEYNQDTSFIHTKQLTYDQLNDYLWNMLWMVGVDEAPFKSVQFSVPGYPCMLITVDTMKENLDDILDVLASVYVSWPLAV
jgi:hypothetical protein